MSLCTTVVFHKYLKIIWYFVAFLGTGLKFSYLSAAAKTPVWLLAVWENIPICHHLGKAWNAGWGLEPIDFIDILSSKYFPINIKLHYTFCFFLLHPPPIPSKHLQQGDARKNLSKPPSSTDTLFGLQSLIGAFSYLLRPLLPLIMNR